MAGDTESGDYFDVPMEEMILIPLEPTCRSFIVWATRTEFRLQQAWVDTVLAVVRYCVQLYFVQESQHRQDQVYQRHRLDNIALSFVYQVCHALFVLDSVFW